MSIITTRIDDRLPTTLRHAQGNTATCRDEHYTRDMQALHTRAQQDPSLFPPPPTSKSTSDIQASLQHHIKGKAIALHITPQIHPQHIHLSSSCSSLRIMALLSSPPRTIYTLNKHLSQPLFSLQLLPRSQIGSNVQRERNFRLHCAVHVSFPSASVSTASHMCSPPATTACLVRLSIH